MKKTIFILALGIILLETFAQAQTTEPDIPVVSAKDTAWKTGGIISFTFSQAYFDNWAAGGEKSVSLNGRANAFAKYQLNKVLWENTLDLAYGFSKQKSTGFRKNDDLIEFTSLYGYKAAKNWYYSAVFNAKSQFSRGYDYTTEPFDTISDFLSPLYINLALGMAYKPNDYFSAFLSPLNLKLTYVNNTRFSVRNSIEADEHLKTELGFIAKFKYQKDIIEGVNFLTKLDLFYDYLDTKTTLYDGTERTKSPYISWEVLINMKVLKVLSVNFNTHLIYDENYRELDDAGVAKDPKIQFKEVFGVGLALNF